MKYVNNYFFFKTINLYSINNSQYVLSKPISHNNSQMISEINYLGNSVALIIWSLGVLSTFPPLCSFMFASWFSFPIRAHHEVHDVFIHRTLCVQENGWHDLFICVYQNCIHSFPSCIETLRSNDVFLQSRFNSTANYLYGAYSVIYYYYTRISRRINYTRKRINNAIKNVLHMKKKNKIAHTQYIKS